MTTFFYFPLCVSSALSAGGADEHAGEDQAGAGFHQAAPVVDPAVAVGEGHPPHKHEAGAQEAAGGDPGDEVSAAPQLARLHFPPAGHSFISHRQKKIVKLVLFNYVVVKQHLYLRRYSFSCSIVHLI